MFLFIELLGTIAFACSGAMVAIKKDLDLLGIVVLGVTTAVGGGMLRDILIGIHPPALFTNPIYVSTAFISVIFLFFIIKMRNRVMDEFSSHTTEVITNFLDAVGLGVFTVVGIDTAIESGYKDYTFLILFLGVITGVGGGLLRDIMALNTPYILKKHFYACASLIGAITYVLLLNVMDKNFAILISSILVVITRILARHYHWNLPHV